jgi:hypothetical protein
MTLTEMVAELRAETGISQNVAHGVASLEPQKALLRRVQEDLYLAHDWPHLKTEATKSLDAGTRYAELPTTFDLTGIESVWTKDTTDDWVPVGYGISPLDYNDYDPDADEREFPIRRWQAYYQATDDVSTNMFEVWPLPLEDAVLLFKGRRAILPLTTDDKTSTLDGPLIVLMAAAEILARQKAEDAGLKLQKGLDRLKWLKARQRGGDTRTINMSGASAPRPLRPGIDYMPRR